VLNKKIPKSKSSQPLTGVTVLPANGSVYGVVARYNAPTLTIGSCNLSMADLLIEQLNLSLREHYPGDGYFAHDNQADMKSESYMLFADDLFYKKIMESVS
jgi:hypothetical protein